MKKIKVSGTVYPSTAPELSIERVADRLPFFFGGHDARHVLRLEAVTADASSR